MKNNLPEGWVWTTLEVVSSKISDGSHNPPKGRESGIPMLSAKNIQDNKIEFDDVRLISEDDYQSEVSRINISAGDVLLTIVGTIGRTAVVEEGLPKFSLQRSVAIIKPVVDSKFLAYCLRTPYTQQYLFDNAKGTAQKGIYLNALKQVPISLPPLAEQRRIVAQLDAVMQKLEASQERLDKLPDLLKKFRQAVLAAAVSGKLTEAWRSEQPQGETGAAVLQKVEQAIDENYHEQCIAAIAEGRRKPKDHRKNKKSIQQDGELASIPDSWVYARLEDLTYQITDGAHHTPTYIEAGVKFLSVKNVRPFAIDASQTRFISAAQHAELSIRCKPELGDILYTKIGSVGYAAINNLDEEFSLFVSVALVKPVKEFISNRYLEIALNAETTLNQAKSRVKGIGTPDLHLVEIRDFKIGIPSLDEQQEIVRQVNHYFELADQLQARFEQAASLVEQLPQALLAKAFSGQLVPQDPDDEPASALLERLHAEPAAPAKGKRGRKAKVAGEAPLFE